MFLLTINVSRQDFDGYMTCCKLISKEFQLVNTDYLEWVVMCICFFSFLLPFCQHPAMFLFLSELKDVSFRKGLKVIVSSCVKLLYATKTYKYKRNTWILKCNIVIENVTKTKVQQ